MTGKVSDHNRADKIIKKVKDRECSIIIKNIGDVKDWYVEVSTDVSFCNLNNGVSSTAAKVVLLVNKVIRVCGPVCWHCNKISKVVDFTLVAEGISLKEGLREVIYVRKVERTCVSNSININIHVFCTILVYIINDYFQSIKVLL